MAHRTGGEVLPPARFGREGEYWTIAYGGVTVRLRDGKGLRYLAHLLYHPGDSIAAVDLLTDARTAWSKRRTRWMATPGGAPPPSPRAPRRSGHDRRLTMNHSSRMVALAVLVALVGVPDLAGAAGSGNTKKGKHALQGNTGNLNTAVGAAAMDPNAACSGAGAPNPCCTGAGRGTCGNSADGNTAVGSSALQDNTTGQSNTAVGIWTLLNNTTGVFNTGLGAFALYLSTTGNANTAVGAGVLDQNQSGSGNTGVGYGVLENNYTANENTAVGDSALKFTQAPNNTAVGAKALELNTLGAFNTAVGVTALHANTTGADNVAVGIGALFSNTTGSGNTAVGENTLVSNTGDANIALGLSAGGGLTTGSYNIDIFDTGNPGESGTIRIGSTGYQTATFIAGISGATSSGGVAVYVNSSGQLGTTPSSARYKEDIQDVGEASSGLLKLRPVRFRYKKDLDPSGLEQYGLVAEEVAKVYPDLVVYDDDGKPQAVRYHFINAMLLNEVQKQARALEAQQRSIRDLEAQLATQARQSAERIDTMAARLGAIEASFGGQRQLPPLEASYQPRREF